MSDPCDPLCPFLACTSCPLNQDPAPAGAGSSPLGGE